MNKYHFIHSGLVENKIFFLFMITTKNKEKGCITIILEKDKLKVEKDVEKGNEKFELTSKSIVRDENINKKCQIAIKSFSPENHIGVRSSGQIDFTVASGEFEEGINSLSHIAALVFQDKIFPLKTKKQPDSLKKPSNIPAI